MSGGIKDMEKYQFLMGEMSALSYIHDKIKDYLEMKKIEIKVLKKLGIDNPY